jgi:phage gp16-like protein
MRHSRPKRLRDKPERRLGWQFFRLLFEFGVSENTKCGYNETQLGYGS